MLNFDRLSAPAHHGETLIEPDPCAMAKSLSANCSLLDELDMTLAGVDLRAHRRRLRQELAGADHGPIVGTGHQPEFIHPGVWAKHVVASRLARSVGGRAVNLVVDSDAPNDVRLPIPSEGSGSLQLRSVRFADVPVGTSYEDFPSADGDAIQRLRSRVSGAMGHRFGESLMPAYLDALNESPDVNDWVGQSVNARKAIERSMGIDMIEHRVSRVWGGPLLVEMICNAHRFAACHNAALADYRKRYRVRSPQRPIPDLAVDGPRCEVAAWVQQDTEPRRRLFVEQVAGTVKLFAGTEPIATWPVDRLSHWGRAQESLQDLAEFRFRPRALTLTLWARLCLCDLFIHGIGGAKYDRITDRLIECYFGIPAPAIACVSATLLLDMPHENVTADALRQSRQRLRSLRYNPQRHLECTGELAELASARAAAVTASRRLRTTDRFNRKARRETFESVRSISGMMLKHQPQVRTEYENDVDRIRRKLQERDIARRRDYFFGLFRPSELKVLLDRLPAVEAFRV